MSYGISVHQLWKDGEMSLFGLTKGSIEASSVSKSPCQITSIDHSFLQPPLLLNLANAFAALDTQILAVIRIALEAPRNPVAEVEEPARRELGPVNSLEAQFEDIRTGRAGFSNGYLEEKCLLKFWQRAYDLLVNRFNFEFYTDAEKKDMLQNTRGVFQRLESEAAPLFELISQALRSRLLKGEAKEVVGLRMTSLDTMFDMYHQRTSTERRLKTWWVVGYSIRVHC